MNIFQLLSFAQKASSAQPLGTYVGGCPGKLVVTQDGIVQNVSETHSFKYVYLSIKMAVDRIFET